MFTYGIPIVMFVLIGLVCVFVAKKRGKDPATWLNVGVIVSALVFLAVSRIKKGKRKLS